MKGEYTAMFPEISESIAKRDDVGVLRDCKQVKPDLLMEMGLAMLDDEPSSGGDTQAVVSMNGAYISAESRLLGNVSEDIRSFTDPSDIDRDEFMVYWKQKCNGPNMEDLFDKLSDEIVLSVFRWLPMKTLKRCALVCQRWRNIAYDEELWVRMDLGGRTLSPGSLAPVIKRGIRILRLAQAELPDPVFTPDCFPEGYVSRLQFLDLSLAAITPTGLTSLLQKTKNLIKLSLEHCLLDDRVCEAIAQNSHLEVLNLAMAENLSPEGLEVILENCTKLLALNLGWTGLNVEALDVFVSNLPPCLSQLNISGCRMSLLDRHIQSLVKGCPKLTELDVSDGSKITGASISAFIRLGNLQHLSVSRCYQLSIPGILAPLVMIRSLRYLDVFNLYDKPDEIKRLRRILPNIEINKFMFCCIARPTVGIRRTSIWGLRVRD